MAAPIYTQTIIALVWDFDRTLTKTYSQQPVFDAYGVNSDEFWADANGLVDLYEARGVKVAKDTAYLLQMINYARTGRFGGLTNGRLIELGATIELNPGVIEFFDYASALPETSDRYKLHGIVLEHYIVSTGLRHLIEGSPVGSKVKGVWANEFVEELPAPGYLARGEKLAGPAGPIAQIGYMLDNTSKTRAIFEINKGPGVDVNARIAAEDRRVPIRNMIYVADGPTDVPVFSVVAHEGGRRLGVYQRGNASNFKQVKQLEDEGRVDSIAEADYTEGTQAWLWLDATIREIADLICQERERRMELIPSPPGHVLG